MEVSTDCLQDTAQLPIIKDSFNKKFTPNGGGWEMKHTLTNARIYNSTIT